MKAHGTRVNYVKREQISSKNQCRFVRHVTSDIHWKIFATVFFCFIAGKCHKECKYLQITTDIFYERKVIENLIKGI